MNDMIRRLCPQILKPEVLCDTDIEAILLGARIASYGDQLPVEIKCSNPETFEQLDPDTEKPTGVHIPVCRHEVSVVANLSDFMFNYSPSQPPEEWTFLLEPYNQMVTIKPLTHLGSLNVTRLMIERQRDLKQLEQYGEYGPESLAGLGEDAVTQYMRVVSNSIVMTMDLLLDAIHQVVTASGVVVKDKVMIEEWASRLPSEKIREINERITLMIEALNDRACFVHVCPQCAYEQKVPIILDADRLFLSAPGGSKAVTNTSGTSTKSKSKRTRPYQS